MKFGRGLELLNAKRRRSGRRLRFTHGQVILLERLFQHCSRPSSACVKQRIRRYPVLSYLAPQAIKTWLACGRYERKHDKEACHMEMLNLQLFVKNQCIVEENEKLRKQAILLSEENRLLQRTLQEQLRCPDEVLET